MFYSASSRESPLHSDNTISMRLGERCILAAFFVATAFTVAFAVVSGIRMYSPVPYWDMWDGYLDFYMAVTQGDWSAWWMQHNEHRIFWSRVLFWLDISWFGGAGVFLVVMNYVLAGLAGLVFCRVLAWSMPGPGLRLSRWCISLFLMGWVFSWCQSENFTWGFQSQFFLAQLLPLCALTALYRSEEPQAVQGTYVLACLFGLASMGTMVNGVIVLPLMVLYAVLLRMSLSRILVLLVLTVGGSLLYFYNYVSPNSASHDSILVILLAHPMDIARNVLAYLGSPFFYLMHKSSHKLQIAIGAGTLLVATSVIWGIAAACRARQAGLRLALLSYLIFIGGTALATAIGRLQFGPEQILSSRYSTPAIMAWAAFFVLLTDSLKARIKGRAFAYLLPLLALHAYVGLVQGRDLSGPLVAESERKLAALALAMGAKDDNRIGLVYPFIGHVEGIAARAAQAELSIFDSPALRGVRARLGTPAEVGTVGECQARVDYVFELAAGDYDRISGWVRGTAVVNGQGAWLSDSNGRRIGYALISSPPLLFRQSGDTLHRFEGYLAKAGAVGLEAVQVVGAGCTARLTSPLPSLKASTANASMPDGQDIGISAVLANGGWTGSDYERSSFKGLQVIGSNVQGDSDTGTLHLKVKSGESVLYRSGPYARSQFLLIGKEATAPVMLPSTEGWIRLEFDRLAWPAQEYEITLTDAGTGFGEWSAVALRLDR